jgi:thiol-disulfide isomerase/thioredoxin
MLQLCLLALLLAGDPALGHWRAALGPVESEVPFDLVLAMKNGALAAEVQNGEEHIAVPEVIWHGSDLLLGFPYYDSRITAKIGSDGKSLSGEWKKRSGKEQWTTLEFRAQAGNLPRFPPLPHTDEEDRPSFQFERFMYITIGDRTSEGLLQFDGSALPRVGGSVLTDTGDLRFLFGTLEGQRLRLSCFDGAFAFLFDGTFASGDSEYAGRCRMGGSTGEWKTRFRHFINEPGQIFEELSGPPRFPLAQLAYSDLDGIERPLAEPLLEGHPMVIEIGGSWCPNCHDEMRMLAELDTKYAAKGLSITELCFEYSGDLERDALQARRMAERHGARFRVLLGGTAERGEPAKAFPVLDKIAAFPTTLFVNRDGTIAALHHGFNGPATGASYEQMRKRFEQQIDLLLASPAPDSSTTWEALLASPWRDEREGLFITIKREANASSFEAEELTRFDRPTREGVVDKGEVRISGTLVKLGPTLFRWDAGTGSLYDPADFAHRLVSAVRPHLPMLDAQMINDPDDLATKLVSADPRWRAETRYHLTRAIKSREAEPRYETWRGIDDEDGYAACAAVFAAGELQHRELAEGIMKLLAHPFAPLRHEAVRALGRLGYEPALVEFERMAKHDLDGAVRALAAKPPKPPPPPPGPPGG